MQYYTALELADKDGKPSGLWHYTCNGGAVGYCSIYRECPECEGRSLMADIQCERCQNKGYIVADPCPGHPSAEEAEAHFHEYQIDHASFDHTHRDQQRPCKICGTWTQRYAQLGGEMPYTFELCDEHHTREFLKQAVADKDRRLREKDNT